MSLDNIRKFRRKPPSALPPDDAGGRVRVLIAVPTLDGYVRWSIAQQFAMAAVFNSSPDCPYAFETYIAYGVMPVERARNQMVDHFMDGTKCDWLMMWDADQEIPDNWPALLTLRDRAPIISATTFVWVADKYAAGRLRLNQYALDEKSRCVNIAPPSATEPYFVPIVGTGCILIHRKVFEKIGRNAFYMTRLENQKIRAGEDINFCVNAQRAGFPILVHPGVVFGHLKEMELRQVGETLAARIQMEKDGSQHTMEQMLSVG